MLFFAASVVFEIPLKTPEIQFFDCELCVGQPKKTGFGVFSDKDGIACLMCVGDTNTMPQALSNAVVALVACLKNDFICHLRLRVAFSLKFC